MSIVRRNKKGFSLIELVLVIVVLAILISTSMYILSSAFQAAFLTRNLSNANWQIRMAFERMSRDIRAVQFPTGTTGITITGGTSITFGDTLSTTATYTYALSGTTLQRTDVAAGITSDLATNISSLSFTPYDVTGTAQGSVSATTMYIKILMTATEGGTNIAFQTTIYPPNFSPGGHV
jgi:prepilin-type N-terminal cleavage/methylation domain-containing protein